MSAIGDNLDPGSQTDRPSAARLPDSPVSPGDVIAEAWVVGPRTSVRGDVHVHRCTRPDDTRIAVFRYRGSQPLPRFLDALRAAGEAWGALRPADGRMPPIVPTLGVGRIVHHTSCYWVQESPRGPSLAEQLAKTPVLAPDYACRLARQVGEALEIVHRAGLVHGDLDPDNVHLLGNADWVRLAWGGLAVRLEAAGMDPGRPGLSELAPEILQGKPASARSDLYATAALLFRMVAGQPPWLVRRKGPLPGVTATDPLPALPPWAAPLSGLLELGLQRDPELRPESVADWLDRLVDAETTFRDLAPSLGTWAPTMAPAAEPPPPSVNRTIDPGQEIEDLDPVLANTPPGLMRAAPPPPADLMSVTPAVPRRVATPPRPLTPPIREGREGRDGLEGPDERGAPQRGQALHRPTGSTRSARPRTPRPWWLPWAAGGASLGAVVFVVVLVGVYRSLTAPVPASVQAPPVVSGAVGEGSTAAPVAPEPAPEPVSRPTVTLESDPPGAEVFDAAGAPLGVTPLDVPLEPGAVAWFELRLPGYQPREITQEWSATPLKRLVELRRRVGPARPAPTPAPPDPPLRDRR